MEGVYIFLIVLGTIWGMYYLLEPVSKCYYKCLPYNRGQNNDV